MARDPLRSLLHVRRAALDEACHILVQRLEAEAVVAAACDRAASLLEQELMKAAQIDGDDGVVEVFAAWLPVGREEFARSLAAHERAAADTARARAAVSLARASHELAVEAVARKQADAVETHRRTEQQLLDDIACQTASARMPGKR